MDMVYKFFGFLDTGKTFDVNVDTYKPAVDASEIDAGLPLFLGRKIG